MFYYKLALKGLFLPALTYHSEEKLEAFEEVLVDLRSKKNMRAFVVKECEKPEFKTQAIKEVTKSSLTPTQIELAKFISYYYNCALGFVLASFEPVKGYELKACEVASSPVLSKDQLEARAFLKANKQALLFANTGCGKSEIYFSFIKDALEKGEQALLLMPEIALTPQMSKRLEEYFKDSFILWHSKISKAKKIKAMQALTESKALLVAGARSALFLPFKKLALVVIDEEHDNSYKASNNPRLNARDLALYLGKRMDIQVILGSATPLATTFYRQKHFRLKKTFFPSKKEYIYDEGDELISPFLLESLSKNHKAGKQAIIFLPTRANFRQLLCRACGTAVSCPFCDIPMSLHKSSKTLRCHYCSFATAIPKACPLCGADMLEPKKLGTAELKLCLEEKLPFIAFHKFDSDELTTYTKLSKVLNDFNKKKIDVLVGTSMLAKGHDYADVGLSVILGLDEYLFHANYKAREETLALAIQVAGRAGRAGVAKVFLQTKQRAFFESFIDDYDSFLKDELAARVGLYPPYKRLLRLIIKNKNEEEGLKISLSLQAALKEIKDLELIGSGPCVLAKIASFYRFYVLLRSDTHQPLMLACTVANTFKGVEADIDPISFS